VNVFLLLAALGAAGLMISAVVDAQARIVWQTASLIVCVGSGVVWAIHAYRWLGHDTVSSPDTRGHRWWW
jgi:hypothetical protein